MHIIYVILLWTCLLLFILRVLGQIYVSIYHVAWLPSMSEWYSGVIPYYQLMPAQLIIIMLMTIIAYDFTRKSGFFFVTKTTTSTTLVSLGIIYFSSMVLRYIIKMTRHPELRWFGECIPIIFHSVLATFILLCGTYSRVVSRHEARRLML